MSWLFSQALVEEYLGDISLDGEQSVQSSGNPIQQAYCAPDKMTDFSRLSRFGMTYKPLTEDRGEELLMSYLEAFHAKTSQQQEKEQELTESEAECGEKWHGSFTKYDPDSSLWKTHQCSLLGDLEPFSETWPRWGLMRSGECWEQQTLAHRTSGTESGLSEKLPTPQASDYITKKTSAGKPRAGVNFSLSNPEIQAKWPDTKGKGLQRRGNNSTKQKIKSRISNSGPESNNRWCNWWEIEPDVGRVADGVAARVDRLKAIGNGQVPEVARTAWKILINN
jgi:hypothetical protein